MWIRHRGEILGDQKIFETSEKDSRLMQSLNNILELNGLSVDILKSLSYKTQLGISLKKKLHFFDKEQLIKELRLRGKQKMTDIEEFMFTFNWIMSTILLKSSLTHSMTVN